MKTYAVVGKPIINSLSPNMHKAAFFELGLDATYIRLASKNAQDAVASAYDMGISGLNVTSPYKEDIIDLVDRCSREAYEIGAINTTLLDRGSDMLGYNTDIQGAYRALFENGSDPKGKKIVIIGAGGAAKAAAYSMIRNGANVVIINRTLEKAQKIAKEFGCESAELGSDRALEHAKKSEIIISCTSSVERMLPKETMGSEKTILDAYYAKESQLVIDAKEHGAKVIDGREWLLYQGARAFEIFTGKTAPIEVMRNAVYTPRVNSQKKNTALTGMMGSGKTSTAYEMAKISGAQLVDIDENIEMAEKRKISEIFEQSGEEKFREIESKEIEKIKDKTNSIIACGGGADLREENRTTITENCKTIWLYSRIDETVKRVERESHRPLLNSPNAEKAQILKRIMEKRIGIYAQTCDLAIVTNRKNPKQVAESILYEIDQQSKD